MEPDYSKYSYEELLDARSRIDEEAHPDNVQRLDHYIKQHESQHESNVSAEFEGEGVAHGVVFTGDAKAFFNIWIVNLLLSICTLGIYSAWAQVRTKRYLYGHTSIDGHRFSYHATPIQILKGRIVAVLLFGGYFIFSATMPVVGAFIAIGVMLLSPLLICKSMQFRMKMTGYRQVRFNFKGRYGQAFLVFFVFPIASVFTLYLALPWALKKIDEFLVDNVTFGNKPFATNIRTSTYFAAGYAAGGLGLVMMFVLMMIVGVNVTDVENMNSGFSFLPIFIFAVYGLTLLVTGSLYAAIIRNHLFAETILPIVARFSSSVKILDLINLRLTNALAILCTLGLAIPWAKIRTSKFFAEHTEVLLYPAINDLQAEQADDASSMGDEISNAFDIDVSIG